MQLYFLFAKIYTLHKYKNVNFMQTNNIITIMSSICCKHMYSLNVISPINIIVIDEGSESNSEK